MCESVWHLSIKTNALFVKYLLSCNTRKCANACAVVSSWQLMTPLLLRGIIIQKLTARTNHLCIFVQYIKLFRVTKDDVLFM